MAQTRTHGPGLFWRQENAAAIPCPEPEALLERLALCRSLAVCSIEQLRERGEVAAADGYAPSLRLLDALMDNLTKAKQQ